MAPFLYLFQVQSLTSDILLLLRLLSEFTLFCIQVSPLDVYVTYVHGIIDTRLCITK